VTDDAPNHDYRKIWTHIDRLPWCALVTTGRAGTDFVQSLLDSHPEISVFNGSHFFHQFWSTARTTTFDGELDVSDILDEYIGAHIHKLRTRYDAVERKGELGELSDAEIGIDRDIFRVHVLGLLDGQEVNSRNFLMSVMSAFDMCLGRDMLAKKSFLHHVHRIGRIEQFRQDFPESKILCMIRDPRANYVSGVEHWRKFEIKTDNPSYPLYIIWRAVDEMRQLKSIPANSLAALRLEDLGDRATLEKLCGWLSISYDACLEHSSWGGLRWWGDRLSERMIPEAETGYSPSMVRNRWQERLGRIDQFVLNHLLAPMLGAYEYEKGRGYHAAWAPLVALAILCPTIYERRYLSPAFLLRAGLRGDIRAVLRSFWHPARRIKMFYAWLWRRYSGDYFAPKWIHGELSRESDRAVE
jgi:hypothetical protein